MFGIGVSELVLIVILALVVVGPKRLPIALRAVGRGIGEFRRAMNELRADVGYDNVVEEVTRPLREGMSDLSRDVMKMEPDAHLGGDAEYPDSGADDYGALPENASVYPDMAPMYTPDKAKALQKQEQEKQLAIEGKAKAIAAAKVKAAALEGTVARGASEPHGDDDGPRS